MLVGREPVCKVIDDQLERLAVGNGCALVVEGEPGIGKSTLLEAIAERARPRGVSVLASRGDQFRSTRPFGLINEALRCEEGQDTGSSLPGEVERVADVIEERSVTQPLLVLLDDAQWADVPSMLVVVELLRRGLNTPAFLALALRPEWRSSAVARPVGAVCKQAEVVVLEPLSGPAVTEMVERLTGTTVDGTLSAHLERAGGNPFLIEELLAFERGVGTRAPAAGGWSGTITDRFDLIDAGTSELVRLASAIGRTFRVDDLAALTHKPAAALYGPLQQACVVGILEEIEEGGTAALRFRHDLLRDALYEAIPPSIRAALQLEISQMLAARGTPATDLAARLSPSTDSAAAVELLGQAARAIRYYQPAEAVRLLERALTFGPPADHDALLIDLLQARSWSGEMEAAAAQAIEQLPAVADPVARVLVLVEIVRNNMTLGRPTPFIEEAVTESFALLDQMEAAGTIIDADRDPLRAIGELTYALVTFGDGDRAERLATRVHELALGHGSGAGIVTSGLVLALGRSLAGYWDDALALVTATASRAREERALMRYGVDGLAALLLSMAGCNEEAKRHWLLHTASWAGSEGLSRAVTPVVEAMLALQEGSWDDVHAAGRAYMSALDEDGFRNNLLFMYSALAHASIAQADLDLAEERLQSAMQEMATSVTLFGSDWVMRGLAMLDAARGDLPAALAGFGRFLDVADATGNLGLPLPALPEIALLAHRVGDRAMLERLVDLGRTMRERSTDAPFVSAIAALCVGETSAAIEVLRTLDRPLDLARALEIGALEHRADPATGAPLLDEAIAIYQRLEATRCIEAARATAEELHVYVRRRTGEAKYAFGWEALTPTEWRVVRMIAQGRSNIETAELLGNSRRTIEAHLRQVFTKLDVPNRLVLATRYRDEIAP